MLVFVAVIGLGLAATAEVWSLSLQREKEAELLFVGNQYREAIGRYYDATPGGGKRYPEKLEDLLEDKRYPMPKRHLRKLYADPMTGKAEWGLMDAPDGGIMGVYSLAEGAPLKQAEFGNDDRTFHQASTYGEWRFFHEPALAAPSVSNN
jgi:type II secretory pathway pseudopilin PulG